MQRKDGQPTGPRSSSAHSHGVWGFLLRWGAVLVTLLVGGWSLSAESAARPLQSEGSQATVAASELVHRAYVPLIMNARPLLDRQRHGFTATSVGWRETFDVAQLEAGWYVDARPTAACLSSPIGMDRAVLIWVHEWATSPRWEWLEQMVNDHPWSIWLVGNEPDCIWQDDILPEVYAQIYHDIYARIKRWDPAAVVSPGGIVQPTPLRLQWLDRVLAEYERRYGYQMPVDVWNIHNAILREARDDWGADIPPGFDGIDVGVWREVSDNDDIKIFKQQIWDFRKWMASRGYAGWPLIVTEFGVLMPVEFGFDADRVNAFMDKAFEFLGTVRSTDPDTLGDPSDDYRLVQRWSWFSLDTPPYDPSIPFTFNGNLFDPYTAEITTYGLNFKTHTHALSPLDYVELRPGSIRFEPSGPIGTGEVVSWSAEVEVWNVGTTGAGPFDVSLAYSGPLSDELRQETSLPAASSTWLVFDLGQLAAGTYDITVSVDVDERVSESTECDNVLEATVLVPSDSVHLPLIVRKR